MAKRLLILTPCRICLRQTHAVTLHQIVCGPSGECLPHIATAGLTGIGAELHSKKLILRLISNQLAIDRGKLAEHNDLTLEISKLMVYFCSKEQRPGIVGQVREYPG